MSGLVKTGVALPSDVVKELDEVAKLLGYRSRSRAITDAIRMFVAMHKWKLMRGEVAGAILVLYDHEVHGVDEELTNAQHKFLDIISATLHIHLSERHCMLIIAVRGEVSRIRNLYSNIASIKGVLHVQSAIFSSTEKR